MDVDVDADADAEDGSMSVSGSETPRRGPRRMMFSRLCSWACWCLMVCFSVDIWVRIATEAGVVSPLRMERKKEEIGGVS